MSRKLALVLSAGANFGAYHAGAWKAISEFFQPDLIVGASVGALNGWAIAGGCPPEEMIDRWLDPRIGGFVRLKLPLFPWQGILDDYRFAEGVRELFHAYRPQLPLAVAVVGLPLLRPKAFFTPSVTWRHLMASCAVPGCFPPQWIDGWPYADGGLAGVLPLWAAAQWGATHAIAVNALPLHAPGVLQTAMSVVSGGRQAPMNVTAIAPRAPLGSIREGLVWKRERVRRWIDLGEEDARRACGVVGFTK